MEFVDALKQVKALIFDVDGVLASSFLHVFPDGEQIRVLNRKDDYILQLAIKKGLLLAIITGGKSDAIQTHYGRMGFAEVYAGAHTKLEKLEEFIKKYNIPPRNILYMGDDIPDYPVMKAVGIPVCPADAATEIKAISLYTSPKEGGKGCVRDIVEQVLTAQNLIPLTVK